MNHFILYPDSRRSASGMRVQNLSFVMQEAALSVGFFLGKSSR